MLGRTKMKFIWKEISVVSKVQGVGTLADHYEVEIVLSHSSSQFP